MTTTTFKSICIPALSTKASIYSTPLTMTSVIISFFIANMSISLNSISVIIRRSGTDVCLLNGVPIGVGSTIQPTDGKKMFLMPGDMIYVQAESNVDIILSILEGIS